MGRAIAAVAVSIALAAGVVAYRDHEADSIAKPSPFVDAIHVVDIDAFAAPTESRPLASARGVDGAATWTPDGSLVFMSDNAGRPALFRQRPDVPLPQLVTDFAGIVGDARPTPDGSAVLFLALPGLLSNQHRIMRVPAGGGEPVAVAAGHFIDGGVRCAIAPAMLCAIAEAHDDGSHVLFTAFNPMSGRGHELARVEQDDFADLRWELSPDGTRIAIADAKGSKIRIVLIGGPAAESITVDGGDRLGDVSFTSDSRGVIVPSIDDDGASLLAISLDGATQVLWEQPGALDVAGVPSPDGRHVAVWVRTPNFDSTP
jgi:Tol biopolymer transport system component